MRYYLQANTFAELAAKIEGDDNVFLDTITGYNAAFAQGLKTDPCFGKPQGASRQFVTPPVRRHRCSRRRGRISAASKPTSAAACAANFWSLSGASTPLANLRELLAGREAGTTAGLWCGGTGDNVHCFSFARQSLPPWKGKSKCAKNTKHRFPVPVSRRAAPSG